MRRSLIEVKHAIADGEDVNAFDKARRTPLFYAAKYGDAAVVSELILHGADINHQDDGLKTALHFAASSYQPDVVEILLNNGAEVDAQDSHGNTPLSDAVFDSKGRGGVIKCLLSFGANKAKKNKHGVSPEELAKTIGNYDIASFLS